MIPHRDGERLLDPALGWALSHHPASLGIPAWMANQGCPVPAEVGGSYQPRLPRVFLCLTSSGGAVGKTQNT